MPPTYRLHWNGQRITDEYRRSANRGLRKAAEHLLGVSRLEVPIEEGTLERSGVASSDASKLEAAVSYGTPYAVYQHETLGLRHDAGRKAKYLEDPWNRERATMLALIAAEIRRGSGGG